MQTVNRLRFANQTNKSTHLKAPKERHPLIKSESHFKRGSATFFLNRFTRSTPLLSFACFSSFVSSWTKRTTTIKVKGKPTKRKHRKKSSSFSAIDKRKTQKLSHEKRWKEKLGEQKACHSSCSAGLPMGYERQICHCSMWQIQRPACYVFSKAGGNRYTVNGAGGEKRHQCIQKSFPSKRKMEKCKQHGRNR